MQQRFLLQVTVLEDLHSGTGTGAAGLDAVQIRDRHDRPTIRASHLKGLLREAAEELAALDEAADPAGASDTKRACRELFGAPGAEASGNLILRSLRPCGPEKETITWTSTARRRFDRGPRDDTLRTVEHVPAGTRFEAELELTDGRLEPLLQRCVRRTIRLGARRSRGSGLVRTQLDPVHDIQGLPVAGRPGPNALRLRLLVANLDPLCLPVTGFPGNVIATECYLRGQALIGALARWAIRRGQGVDDLLAGRIVVGNGYPIPVSEAEPETARWEVVPIPLSATTRKPGPQQEPFWPWWAETAEAPPEPEETEQDRKRPGDREFLFRRRSAEDWERFQPAVTVHLRNDAGARRRDGGDGELFSCEEIAEDTLFLVDLSFPDQKVADRFRQTFGPVLTRRSWLTAGRGGTPIDVRKAEWLGPLAPSPPNDDQICITLTSDMIARGPHLGFYDRLDPDVLIELAVSDADERRYLTSVAWDVDRERSASDWVEVRGFNAASGLPRSPALAIRRGSCLVLAGPSAGIKSLHNSLKGRWALGDRRHEGFGQFRIDSEPLRIAPKSGSAAADNSRAAELEALIAKVYGTASTLVPDATESGPSSSQWMRLWRRLETAADEAAMLDVLTAFADRGGTYGGRAWKRVDFAPLRAEIERSRAKGSGDIRQFLHLTIRRRIRGSKRASEEREPEQQE